MVPPALLAKLQMIIRAPFSECLKMPKGESKLENLSSSVESKGFGFWHGLSTVKTLLNSSTSQVEHFRLDACLLHPGWTSAMDVSVPLNRQLLLLRHKIDHHDPISSVSRCIKCDSRLLGYTLIISYYILEALSTTFSDLITWPLTAGRGHFSRRSGDGG